MFVLGYREYEARDNAAAAKDLAGAAAMPFPFADLATYYEASAVYRNGDPATTVKLLQSFPKKFPASTVREDAAELMAWAYLQTGDPADAIRTLTAIPGFNENPRFALLLARAYQDANRLISAANAYQNVYYAFPDTSQSREAKKALVLLKVELGNKFPSVSDRIATARAETLLRKGNDKQALDEFDSLLKEHRGSLLAWQWNLDRGRCLISLGKADQTIETLAGATAASPAVNAERLEILVRAYVEEKDDASVNKTLNELEASYPNSEQLAEALQVVAGYYQSQPDLRTAATLYHRLAQSFAETPEGRKARWDAAWAEFLAGDRNEAAKDFLALIRSYPSSLRVPGAIYFLGRIAEEQGNTNDARADYELVRTHFIHDYYAEEAAQRLRNLTRRHATRSRRMDSENSRAAREIARLVPARDPIGIDSCRSSQKESLPDSYFTLHALGLDNLARKSAEKFAAQKRRSPELSFSLGRLDSETGRPDLAIHRVKRVAPRYDWYPFSEFSRDMWDLLYPRAYWSLVRRYANAYHLEPYFVMALIRQESGFFPKADSPADARGLMQILPSTASGRRSRRVIRRLNEPSFNIRLGCEYMRQLLRKYKGSLAEALAAYNAGPHNVDRWIEKYRVHTRDEFIETIPYPGTRVYVKAVFRDAAVYRRLLNGLARYRTCGAVRERKAKLLRRRNGRP